MSSSDFRCMKRLYNQDILYDSGESHYTFLPVLYYRHRFTKADAILTQVQLYLHGIF
jgi:hypothetical protein